MTSAIRCPACGSTLARIIRGTLRCANEKCQRPIKELTSPAAAPETTASPVQEPRRADPIDHKPGSPW